jgi:hypothetical protein
MYNIAYCIYLASQRLFTCDSLAHIVSFPNSFAQQLLSTMASAYVVAILNGSTHWLLSAIAFVAHTIFMSFPLNLSAMTYELIRYLGVSLSF